LGSERSKLTLSDALTVLKNANVDFQMGDAKLCQLRCAQQVAQFKDPSGNRHELIWGFKSDFAHFASPMGVSGFVTGNIGMGHTVLPAPAFDETVKFCTESHGLCIVRSVQFPTGWSRRSNPAHSLFPLQQRPPPQPGLGRLPSAQRLCPRDGGS
jgi:3,4-dihydroxy-9,10-secoandrosta-1,3,5(10)-triene-9,17-dione 4,5-dioxygenase